MNGSPRFLIRILSQSHCELRSEDEHWSKKFVSVKRRVGIRRRSERRACHHQGRDGGQRRQLRAPNKLSACGVAHSFLNERNFTSVSANNFRVDLLNLCCRWVLAFPLQKQGVEFPKTSVVNDVPFLLCCFGHRRFLAETSIFTKAKSSPHPQAPWELASASARLVEDNGGRSAEALAYRWIWSLRPPQRTESDAPVDKRHFKSHVVASLFTFEPFVPENLVTLNEELFVKLRFTNEFSDDTRRSDHWGVATSDLIERCQWESSVACNKDKSNSRITYDSVNVMQVIHLEQFPQSLADAKNWQAVQKLWDRRPEMRPQVAYALKRFCRSVNGVVCRVHLRD